MQADTEDIPPPKPFELDLRVLAIGAESVPWLSALIETARDDLQPRNFPEHHLVDEMALNKWRLMRVYGMEKAVYEHQLAGFRPKSALMADGQPAELNEDLYHLAGTNSPDRDGLILAALSRLEARFHRQFYTALRMFTSLRRANPVYLTPGKPKSAGTQTNEKGENPCSPSPSKPSSVQTTTKQPNDSTPNSSL